MAFFKAVLFMSLGVLFHAAYSVAEWRYYSRKTDQDTESIPWDIIIQTLAGFLLAMIAVLNIAGEFKEIRATVELSQKSWEDVRNRPSFYLFNHRAMALSPDYVPPSPSASGMGRSHLTKIPDKYLS
ncbi:hypothetical protein TCAL_11669 [Tigriopus californicus]|uniref:Membrane magnesium transporter n=1 Tax=Tigriopus californicus TaxID=6832 RepID=A0A553PP97_TIGCA|nr:ER membrane protein complex subunit 5-like [Tigriopus californicus]TRY79506.1 hypothetical protein TCAL_11669 [Tigriopus californicus]|eukprot:TCALIF_11669-PA protein Name:"Similar to mmgt1 Membrane magnesium transporter 1 (Danio rerio)" AED:0.43 eAED:0.43 QI:0/-1/0/1/-1/1/1/0/126